MMQLASASLSTLGIFAGPLSADAVDTPQDSERQQVQAAKIRLQYLDAETPDGIMFQSLIRRTSERFAADPEHTIRKVMSKMNFESDAETVDFILILEEQHRRLSETKLSARRTILCNADPNRSEEDLFRDVDSMLDIQITLAATAHDKFLASLDSDYSTKFSNWLDDAKQGFQYYGFRADSSFKNSGIDPISYYRDQCIQIEGTSGKLK